MRASTAPRPRGRAALNAPFSFKHFDASIEADAAGTRVPASPLRPFEAPVPLFTCQTTHPREHRSRVPGFQPESCPYRSDHPRPHRPRPTARWWRRTGLNRRPPACKAGALPLSYAPYQRVSIRPHTAPGARVPGASRCALSWPGYAPLVQRGSWWAREDLNFRPHAYQARALTN
jgi:hypothetical protein